MKYIETTGIQVKFATNNNKVFILDVKSFEGGVSISTDEVTDQVRVMINGDVVLKFEPETFINQYNTAWCKYEAYIQLKDETTDNYRPTWVTLVDVNMRAQAGEAPVNK